MNWILISVILFLALLFSGSLNIFLLWYAWRSIQHIKYCDNELSEVIGVVRTFTNHLKSVYNMETFYGDETLRHLLKHAEDLTDVFDQYDSPEGDDITEEEIINDDTTEAEA